MIKWSWISNIPSFPLSLIFSSCSINHFKTRWPAGCSAMWSFKGKKQTKTELNYLTGILQNIFTCLSINSCWLGPLCPQTPQHSDPFRHHLCKWRQVWCKYLNIYLNRPVYFLPCSLEHLNFSNKTHQPTFHPPLQDPHAYWAVSIGLPASARTSRLSTFSWTWKLMVHRKSQKTWLVHVEFCKMHIL